MHSHDFVDCVDLYLLASRSAGTTPMSDKGFFDTNVLVYIVGQKDERTVRAEALVASGGVVSVQILNELASVARRKLGMTWDEVGEALAAIRVLCPSPVPLTIETHEAGLRIAAQYGFHIYDALVVAAALEAECATLYSEDLQDGQVIDGRLTIRNPFTI
jgi:predicted nucleic acid-binding protein